ncbi:MAG TPA: hypothetical protein VGE52_04045 [Pirellulales bacterium]
MAQESTFAETQDVTPRATILPHDWATDETRISREGGATGAP